MTITPEMIRRSTVARHAVRRPSRALENLVYLVFVAATVAVVVAHAV